LSRKTNNKSSLSKGVLYKYRWCVSLLNLVQPGLGFAVYRKWIDCTFTILSYVIGFIISFRSLSDPHAPSWQIYLGVGLVVMAFLYSIIKPILIISPDKKSLSDDTDQKTGKRIVGGIEKFWLLQFLNRLWPGLGLLATRYWQIGFALVLLGIGMYIIPEKLWPENQMWIRKVLFIITFAAGFLTTLSLFGYSGSEKRRTWLVVFSVAILSVLNIRYTDMIRDNFAFVVIENNLLSDYGLKTGDFMVSKTISADYDIQVGQIVVYGDNNYRQFAIVVPYSDLLNRDSVFAVGIKTLFPESTPLPINVYSNQQNNIE